jgi:hypothetical protein
MESILPPDIPPDFTCLSSCIYAWPPDAVAFRSATLCMLPVESLGTLITTKIYSSMAPIDNIKAHCLCGAVHVQTKVLQACLMALCRIHHALHAQLSSFYQFEEVVP